MPTGSDGRSISFYNQAYTPYNGQLGAIFGPSGVDGFDACPRVHQWRFAKIVGGYHIQRPIAVPALRALERLDIDDIHAVTFQWAVQQKRYLDGTDRSIGIGSSHGHRGTLMLVATTSPFHQTHGLVSLELVRIRKVAAPGADDINDILFAFSHSLWVVGINARIPVALNFPNQSSLDEDESTFPS